MDDFDTYVMREGVAGSLTSHVCRTCKWWRIQIVQTEKTYGYCDAANDNEPPESAFWVESYDGGWLRTKPDFGCNQWETK